MERPTDTQVHAKRGTVLARTPVCENNHREIFVVVRGLHPGGMCAKRKKKYELIV
jgi:hypothetical protein